MGSVLGEAGLALTVRKGGEKDESQVKPPYIYIRIMKRCSASTSVILYIIKLYHVRIRLILYILSLLNYKLAIYLANQHTFMIYKMRAKLIDRDSQQEQITMFMDAHIYYLHMCIIGSFLIIDLLELHMSCVALVLYIPKQILLTRLANNNT